ncbi:MAG: YceI family protein, partial [Chloroflexota bacterium]
SPGSSGSAASTAANAGSTSASAQAGTWTVGSDSVVGYRVREQLGGVSALTDAVGRTSSVTGEATIEPSGSSLRVTKASFEADLTTLKSDRTMRDNRIRTMGLESATYPKATFVLTEPIDVPAAALTGSTVDVTLNGDLTIHGVTRRVAIPAQARLANGRVEVTGSLTFPFADFGMTPPNVAGFVSVENDATLEFLVALDKATA